MEFHQCNKYEQLIVAEISIAKEVMISEVSICVCVCMSVYVSVNMITVGSHIYALFMTFMAITPEISMRETSIFLHVTFPYSLLWWQCVLDSRAF